MDREFYDRYYELEAWHWWFVGRRKIVEAEARRRLAASGRQARPRILDVGCGTGVMLGRLGALGQAQGVEMEAAAVEYCHQRGVADVQLASEPPLPFEDGVFDLVTALDVLEHIEDHVAMVSEIARLLRPGGTMIATVPAFPALWGLQDEVSHHYRRYVRSSLLSVLGEGGMRVERVSYFNTLLFPPIAGVRLLRRLLPAKDDLSSDFEMTKSSAANRVLAAAFSSERRWLARRSFPFGVSLLAVATRP